MRLLAANLRPSTLGDLAAAPSTASLVPKIGIHPDAACKQAGKAIAAISDAGTGQAAVAWHFNSPIGRTVLICAGATGKSPP
jgi:hypothetical protein